MNQIGDGLNRDCPHSGTIKTCADCLIDECRFLELLVIRKNEALASLKHACADAKLAAWIQKEIDAKSPWDNDGGWPK